MPRERNPNRDKAYELYKENHGKITPKTIGDILNESSTTISAWKYSDKWNDKLGIIKRYNKKTSKKIKGSLYNVENNGELHENLSVRKMEWYSKYMPRRSYSIYEEIKDSKCTLLEIQWYEILQQYATIIDNLKMLHVESRDDHTKVLKKESKSGNDYVMELAFDKQLKSLKELSNARKILFIMIEKYENQLNKNWELATEEQKSRIQVLKSKIVSKDDSKEEQLDKYFEMLESAIKQ